MASIYIKAGSVIIKGPATDPAIQMWYDNELIERERALNTYATSIQNLPQMLEVYPVANQSLRDAATQELHRQAATQDLIENGPAEGETYLVDGLWEHQKLGISLARINKRFAFFFDTRTGKTLTSINIMTEALKSGAVTRWLVVCPSAIIPSWQDDIHKFMPMLKVATYFGTKKQKDEALRTPCHIFIISAEILAKNLEMLKAFKFGGCIVDESSKLKSHRSQISKAALELSECIERWYILSATPAPNGAHEYFIQMKTVDKYIFPTSRSKFVLKYFNNLSYNPTFEKLELKPEMKEQFFNLIKTKAVYIDQGVMPTAGSETVIYRYDLTEELRSIYDEFRKKAVVELHGGEKISTDQIAQINSKLSQITSGFLIDTEAIKYNSLKKELGSKERHETVVPLASGNQRVQILVDLLQSLNEAPVVIWANFKQEFISIKQALGDDCAIINGSVDVNEKHRIIRAFKAGKIKYLVCHPLSLGMGVNLTEAHIAIYYSLNYSWEQLKQSSERIRGHIKVQPKKAIYYILAARGTIDEAIYSAVKNKKASSREFLAILEGGI